MFEQVCLRRSCSNSAWKWELKPKPTSKTPSAWWEHRHGGYERARCEAEVTVPLATAGHASSGVAVPPPPAPAEHPCAPERDVIRKDSRD